VAAPSFIYSRRSRAKYRGSVAADRIRVKLRRDARTGDLIVSAPDYPELDQATIETIWNLGWRPREYDDGELVLSRVDREAVLPEGI